MSTVEAPDGEASNTVERDPIRQVFAPLAADGYVFSTVKGRRLSWVFVRLWIVPSLLLVALVAVGLMALPLSEDRFILKAEGYVFPGRFVDGAMRLDAANSWDSSARLVSGPDGLPYVQSGRTGERLPVSDWFDIASQAQGLARETVIYVLPLFLLMVLLGFLYGRFTRTAPRMLAELAWAGRLKPGPDQMEKTRGIGPFGWRSYVTDLEQALQGRWRLTVLAGLLIVALPLAYLLVRQRGVLSTLSAYPVSSQTTIYLVWELLILGFAPLVIVFFFGHALWLLVVMGTYLRRLTDVFDLDIQLGHGDRCGGLKRLGDICLQMTLIVLLPAVGLGAWVLTGIVGRSIPAVGIMVYTTVAIMALVAMFTFFMPVWRVHTEMVRARLAFQDRATDAIAPVEERLRMLLAQGRLEDEETARLEKQLERLRQLYPADLKTFTWPFDLSIAAAFSSSLLVPALSLVIQFDEAVEAVKSIGGRFGLGG